MKRSIDIDLNQFVHLRGHGDDHVRVACGRVWLTIEGDPDDHLLARGQSLGLPRGARVLVQALDAPARLAVQRPDGAWQRAMHVVRSLRRELHLAASRHIRLGTLL